MAMTNLTLDRNYEALAVLLCSKDIAGGIHHQLILLSVLNIFLSITAFLGNTLILVALHKVSSLHPPSKLLFRTLVTTDLCVGIILQPLSVATFISMVNERWNICRYAHLAGFVTAYILCSVSLMTLTTISVDRLLALFLGLRYRNVVTLKRTYLTVTSVWFLSIVNTALYFWNYRITLHIAYIGISACLVASVYSYIKIFFTLRHNRIQVQSHVQQGLLLLYVIIGFRYKVTFNKDNRARQTTSLNTARYRRTVFTALWLQLGLVVCYLPYNVAQAYIAHRGLTPSVFLGWAFSGTMVFLNSTLNPILDCWRNRAVKQAVKNTVRRLYR